MASNYPQNIPTTNPGNTLTGGGYVDGTYTTAISVDPRVYYSYPSGYAVPSYSAKELEVQQLTAMLRSRLRVPQHEQLPFDHIHPTRVDGTDTVLVLVINNKQHVLIEDGYELFPSDTLITQLRLLAK